VENGVMSEGTRITIKIWNGFTIEIKLKMPVRLVVGMAR
jgi:hypothetical protein